MVDVRASVANEDLAPVLSKLDECRDRLADQMIAGREGSGAATKAHAFLSRISDQIRAHKEWLEKEGVST